MERQIYVRILLLIMVLGLLLRLYHLDRESLWTDESFSVQHAGKSTISEVISGVKETEAAPVGYYIILYGWIKLFGDSATSVRFPSVLFGLLAILILFLLVRKKYDVGTALVASFFLSTSMLQVLYSQEARIYSLFTLLVLSNAYFFMEIIRREKSGKKTAAWYGLYGLSLLASLYTNYLGLAVMVLSNLFLFWKEYPLLKQIRWKWCWLHSFVIFFSLPLVSVARSQYTLLHFGLAEILEARGLPSWLAQLGLWFFLLPLLMMLSFLLLLFFIGKGGREAAPEGKLRKEKFFLTLLALGGAAYLYLTLNPLKIFGLTLLSVPLTHSYFLVRHSLFLAPLLYIYLARKIVTLSSRRMLALGILLVVVVNSFSLYWYYEQPTKAEWKEAAEFISSHSAGDVPAVLLDLGGMANKFLLDYHSDGKFRIIPLTWADRAKVGRKLEQLNSLQVSEMVQGQEEVWLVLSRNTETGDKYKEMLGTLLVNNLYQEFYQIKVYRYKTADTSSSPKNVHSPFSPKVDLYKWGVMKGRGAYG